MKPSAANIKTGTKAFLGLLVTCGGLFQIKEVHDFLIQAAHQHPHVIGVIGTVTGVFGLLYNPQVQAVLNADGKPHWYTTDRVVDAKEEPAKAEGERMNIFSKVVTGLTNAETFLLNVFTKTSQVYTMLTKLSPAVIAAMLAVFYDVLNAVKSAVAAASAAETANIPSAITLSTTTLALVQQVAKDAVAGEQLIVADLKLLGHAVDTPAAAPVAAAPVAA